MDIHRYGKLYHARGGAMPIPTKTISMAVDAYPIQSCPLPSVATYKPGVQTGGATPAEINQQNRQKRLLEALPTLFESSKKSKPAVNVPRSSSSFLHQIE